MIGPVCRSGVSDKLILPFRFIPDGSPEAQLPPPPGHIRIPARFIPHVSAGDEDEDDDADSALVDADGVDDVTDGVCTPA